MIFSLDVRRARKGDCLMVHYGSKDDPGLALIDGGPAQVYKPHLKPRLTPNQASARPRWRRITFGRSVDGQPYRR